MAKKKRIIKDSISKESFTQGKQSAGTEKTATMDGENSHHGRVFYSRGEHRYTGV